MKVVIQRARDASVTVGGEVTGYIEHGLVALVGITHEDTVEDIDYIVGKLVHLRIFEDDFGKMNISLKDVGGSVLSISQFTLYGDVRKGRRPNFMNAAKPDIAKDLYEEFNLAIKNLGVNVETGIFGEMMDVKFTNVGPVTMILDSEER